MFAREIFFPTLSLAGWLASGKCTYCEKDAVCEHFDERGAEGAPETLEGDSLLDVLLEVAGEVGQLEGGVSRRRRRERRTLSGRVLLGLLCNLSDSHSCSGRRRRRPRRRRHRRRRLVHHRVLVVRRRQRHVRRKRRRRRPRRRRRRHFRSEKRELWRHCHGNGNFVRWWPCARPWWRLLTLQGQGHGHGRNGLRSRLHQVCGSQSRRWGRRQRTPCRLG